MIKSIFLFKIFLMFISISFGQITNSNIEPKNNKKEKKKKPVKEKKLVDSLNTNLNQSTYYLTGAFINSFRNFEDLSPYQSLGKKYNETNINTYGLGFGTLIPLAKKIDLEIGISYVLQGEQYTYKDSLTDSTFHYVNKYKHFGIPLRLKYTIGNGKLKATVKAGVIPTSILSIRYESEYTKLDSSLVTNDIVTKTNNLKSFNIVGSVALGLQYDLDNISFVLTPEYRYNFFNTYINYPVKHNLWSWGINAGILLKI